MMVSWLIILFLVLVFVDSLIVLAVKGGTAGRIIAGVICCVILLVLFLGGIVAVPVSRSVVRDQQVQLLEETQQRVDEIRRRGEDIRLRGEEMRNGIVRIGSSNRMNVETSFSDGVATSVSHEGSRVRMGFFPFPFIVIGVALLIGLVIAIVKGTTVGGVVGRIVLFGLMFVALFFGLRFMSVWKSNPAGQVGQDTITSVQSAADTGVIWREGVEHELKADVYLSKSAAIVGLGREVENIVIAILDQQSEPGRVRILESEVEGHLLGELKQMLSGSFPDMVSIVPADATETEQGVTISLAYAELGQSEVQVNQLGQPDALAVEYLLGGRLEASIQSAKGKEICSVKFSEKTWLTDTTKFIAANPNQNWQVVRSEEACVTEQQAMTQAIERACNMLRVQVGNSNVAVTEQDLIEGGFISDRFTQSFYGSAGKIWRAAVLVDASPKRLRFLAGKKTAVVKHHFRGLLNQGFTLAGIITLICLVYFFLNAATKGYYSWAMRFAAVVLILAGIFIVLMMS